MMMWTLWAAVAGIAGIALIFALLAQIMFENTVLKDAAEVTHKTDAAARQTLTRRGYRIDGSTLFRGDEPIAVVANARDAVRVLSRLDAERVERQAVDAVRPEVMFDAYELWDGERQ